MRSRRASARQRVGRACDRRACARGNACAAPAGAALPLPPRACAMKSAFVALAAVRMRHKQEPEVPKELLRRRLPMNTRLLALSSAGRALVSAGAAAPCRCPAKIHDHRHRRRDRRVLRRGRRHLPPGQQGPRQARHSLLRGIDRGLGVQREHDQGRRARSRRRAIRRSVQRVQGSDAVQGRRLHRPARRHEPASRAFHRAHAQGAQREVVRRHEGQEVQRRQPRLGDACLAGGIADRA